MTFNAKRNAMKLFPLMRQSKNLKRGTFVLAVLNLTNAGKYRSKPRYIKNLIKGAIVSDQHKGEVHPDISKAFHDVRNTFHALYMYLDSLNGEEPLFTSDEIKAILLSKKGP